MAVLSRLVRRTIIFIVSIVVSSIVVFAFMTVLPGDPARVILGMNATPEAIAQMRAEFGLDRPLVVQYLDWAGGLLTGDFGVSYITQTPIGPQIMSRMMVSLWLVGSAIVLALVIAVPSGVFAALRHRKFSGLATSGASQIGIAIPQFVMGIGLIFVFAIQLNWLPAGGWVAPSEDMLGFLKHLALPAVSLGLIQAAMLTRYVRSAILDVLGREYIRTARAKGLGQFKTIARHGLRNASVPVVTILGLQLTTLLVATIVIERVFVVPGLGDLLLSAVGNRDLILVQGVVMLLVVAALVVNFAVDVTYTLLDPRLVDS